MQLDPCFWCTFITSFKAALNLRICTPGCFEKGGHSKAMRVLYLMRNLNLSRKLFFIKLCILKQWVIPRKHFHNQHILTIITISNKNIKSLVNQAVPSQKNSVCERKMKGFFYKTVEFFVILWYDTKVNTPGKMLKSVASEALFAWFRHEH